jgi:hypothetical protein
MFVPRRISRRTWFFLVLMGLGLAMVAPTPGAYEGAAWFVVIASALWAALFLIEDLLTPVDMTDRSGGPRPDEPSPEALFAPPPVRRPAPSEERERV